MIDNFEENGNRMTSTNGVFAWVNVLLKGFKVMTLNTVHAFTIKFLDALPNLSIQGFMICEIESISPMTEIRWEDEYIFRIIKVLGKYLAIVISHLLIDRPRHNRHQLDILAQALENIRQMHLQTMLILLVVNVDHMKSLLLLKFIHH